MIKFNLLKESKETSKWRLYTDDPAPNYFTQNYRGLNIINTSPRMDNRLGRDNNMKIVYGNAQSGKTNYLIYESIECNYTIVCHNIQEKHRLMRQAESLYNRRLPTPITYQEYIRCEFREIRTVGFLIDNINLFLDSFRAPVPTKGFTIRTYGN